MKLFTLPGWQGSGPDHWQTLWEAELGAVRVEQADWLWPRRGDWMARLDEVLLDACDPGSPSTQAVLVAHSLGCQLVAAWAEHSRHTGLVRAALLVAPPDVERDDMPPNLFNWRPIRRSRLPFDAIAVISNDDPYGTPERTAGMAADWGAEVVDIGACGHINDRSGLGAWPQGKALLRSLVNDDRPETSMER